MQTAGLTPRLHTSLNSFVLKETVQKQIVCKIVYKNVFPPRMWRGCGDNASGVRLGYHPCAPNRLCHLEIALHHLENKALPKLAEVQKGETKDY